MLFCPLFKQVYRNNPFSFQRRQYSIVSTMANYATESILTCLTSHKNDSNGRSYRSAMELIALILQTLRNSSTTSYALRKHAGTSTAQIKKYLELLMRIGFVETYITGDKVSYITSGTGLAFLKQYNVLWDMLQSAYHETNQLTLRRNNAIGLTYNRVLQPILKSPLQSARA